MIHPFKDERAKTVGISGIMLKPSAGTDLETGTEPKVYPGSRFH
jgi:hypothetical protein